jgi:hypothetical protein
MILHLLPGDAQVDAFRESRIEGELLVCREALVEGDLGGENLDEFFAKRAAFLGEELSKYAANVASQLRPLQEAKTGDEINLWFEYELFCAVNMWFCLSLLETSAATVHRVAPVYLNEDDRWNGFGGAIASDMLRCFDERIKLSADDLSLGAALWRAYRAKDEDALLELSATNSAAFPYLVEVGKAAAEKDLIPANIIAEIESEGINNFNEIFLEFRRRAGVYGYGDSQVKKVMAALTS